MNRVAVAALVLGATTASAQERTSSAPVVIQTAEAGGVKVSYLTIPWGPLTFAEMEAGGTGFYNTRTWPFAHLETQAAVTLDGTKIPAGSYALVFHPNGADKKGMALEVLKVTAEFLQAGNVMTKTPEGERVHKGPIEFAAAKTTLPSLKIELVSSTDAVTMTVRYGNRELVKQLKL